MNHCCPNAIKESRSERVGLYRNEQGVFCLPGTSVDSITLQRCHRSHRQNHVYREGTDTDKQEGNKINAMHNMMHDHDMAICYVLS